MPKKVSNQLRVKKPQVDNLRALAKANRLGLNFAHLGNLAIVKGLPLVVKEIAR
jgi:hypothetical protein